MIYAAEKWELMCKVDILVVLEMRSSSNRKCTWFVLWGKKALIKAYWIKLIKRSISRAMFEAPFNTKFKLELQNLRTCTSVVLNDDMCVKQWKEEPEAYLKMCFIWMKNFVIHLPRLAFCSTDMLTWECFTFIHQIMVWIIYWA